MRKLLICATLVFGFTAAGASEQTVDKPARVISTLVKRAAIVEAVDKSTRELRLLDAQGNRFSVIADDVVRNFDQIEPRDRIIMEYVESVAIVVAPQGSEVTLGDGSVLTVAAEGDKPGIGGVETVLMVATVQSLNAADRLVTLQTEQGGLRTIKVGDNVPLELVEVGDQVRMRVTTAVAVNVVRPDAN